MFLGIILIKTFCYIMLFLLALAGKKNYKKYQLSLTLG